MLKRMMFLLALGMLFATYSETAHAQFGLWYCEVTDHSTSVTVVEGVVEKTANILELSVRNDIQGVIDYSDSLGNEILREGWFRVDLRKGWIARGEVLFIKPKT